MMYEKRVVLKCFVISRNVLLYFKNKKSYQNKSEHILKLEIDIFEWYYL